ncbi:hypothetical protein HDC33_000516 [Sporosarcina sp. JAI121]|nr:hypothetical protein [Sporosarcina sp. JAI121]
MFEKFLINVVYGVNGICIGCFINLGKWPLNGGVSNETAEVSNEVQQLSNQP